MNKLTIEEIGGMRNKRGIGDGIHDVSEIKEIIELDMEGFYKVEKNASKEDQKRIVDFCNKYPDFRIGEAYQCYTVFLLSNPPKKFVGKQTGTGFNYGSANLLEDCPAKLLILAQDD